MDKDCLKCSKCDRECRSVAGRKTHKKAYKAQKKENVLQPPTSYEKNSASVSSHVEDGENLQHKALVWGNHTCYDLTQVISAVYDEIAKKYIQSSEWCSGEKICGRNNSADYRMEQSNSPGQCCFKMFAHNLPHFLLQKQSKKI